MELCLRSIEHVRVLSELHEQTYQQTWSFDRLQEHLPEGIRLQNDIYTPICQWCGQPFPACNKAVVPPGRVYV